MLQPILGNKVSYMSIDFRKFIVNRLFEKLSEKVILEFHIKSIA